MLQETLNELEAASAAATATTADRTPEAPVTPPSKTHNDQLEAAMEDLERERAARIAGEMEIVELKMKVEGLAREVFRLQNELDSTIKPPGLLQRSDSAGSVIL